jgi:hypothetical protein
MTKKVLLIFLGAIIFTIVGQSIHSIGAFLTMPYYQSPEYFNVWSSLMMPQAGPPPMSFYLFSCVFSLIQGLIFATVFLLLLPALKRISTNRAMLGVLYGLIIFAVCGISQTFSMLLLINLPSALIGSWMIECFLIYLGGGVLISLIVKE